MKELRGIVLQLIWYNCFATEISVVVTRKGAQTSVPDSEEMRKIFSKY